MRICLFAVLIAGTAVLTIIDKSVALSAYDYPWCALYAGRSGGAQSCYFTSREQCMTTMSGIGGVCIQSPYYTPQQSAQRRARKH